MDGAFIFDEHASRVVYLATSFVADFDDCVVVTGRIAADGAGGIGLQDIGIRIEPDAPIAPERLRRLPWSKMLDRALDHGALPFQRMSDGSVLVDTSQPKPPGADVRLKRAGGRRRLDDDHYRQVAAVYRRSMSAGGDPVVSVQMDLGAKSRGTAARWVGEARKRGFLGPAPARGAKGELR